MKKWVLSVEFFDHVEQAVYTSREEALATAEAIIGDYEHGMRKIIVLSLDGTIAKLRLFKVTDGINSRSPASV